MLQQTPVARVLPVYEQWLARWPTPGRPGRREPTGEAVRAWGRLGYPRRALRLHAAATAIVERARRRGARRPTTTCSRCPGSATTPPRRSRPSPSGGGTSCSTPTSAGCWRGPCSGVEFPRAVGHPGRARPRRPACCPTTARPPRPGRWPPWSSARWSASAASPRCARLPGRRPVRVAGGRLPGVRRAAAARPDLRRHRPAVPRPAARPCSATATARCTAAALDAAWPARPSSASGASPGWSTTGWWPRSPSDAYALP